MGTADPGGRLGAEELALGELSGWTLRGTFSGRQCVRPVQNSTVSSSARFIGESGNSASASRAITP